MDFVPIADGFCFLEGPRADGDAVWFSEVILGGVRRWSPDGTVTAWLPERQWIGGLAVNQDGTILFSGIGGIAWLDPVSGETGMMLQDIDGQAIAGVNDMHPDGNGGLYFGTIDYDAFATGAVPRPSGLYHMAIDGAVRCVSNDVSATNGMGLSPDGRIFYHNESSVGTHAYTVSADGTLTDKRLLLAKPDCDGLAVDSAGGIWVAGYETAAIIRLSPTGVLEQALSVPAAGVTSLCFGGPDNRDVYVTTLAEGSGDYLMNGTLPAPTAALYRGRSDRAGQPPHRTGFGPEHFRRT